jgi:hypothetical protein
VEGLTHPPGDGRNGRWRAANIPGKPRLFMPLTGGFPAYAERCAQVAANRHEEFSRLTAFASIVTEVYVDSRRRSNVSNAQILLKKSEIEDSRKSRFRAHSVDSTSSFHSRA